jgi:hypothetical protein
VGLAGYPTSKFLSLFLITSLLATCLGIWTEMEEVDRCGGIPSNPTLPLALWMCIFSALHPRYVYYGKKQMRRKKKE